MRNILPKTVAGIVFFLIANTITLKSNSLNLAPSDSFRLEGNVICNEQGLPGAIVNAYTGNIKVRSIMTNRNGVYVLYLQHNKEYILESVKIGFVTVKIALSTKVSDDVIAKGGIGETFDVNIKTYENYPELKLDVFNNPVETYKFNATKTWFFEADPKKSKASQIAAISNKITGIKTRAYQDAFKKGNALYNKKSYDEALLEFSRALEYLPGDQAATDKTKEIRKLLKKQGKLDDEYKQIISTADEKFKNEQFEDALANYKKASAYNPEDKYPQTQVSLIDSILSRKYEVNKKEYDKIIVSADAKYKNKDTAGARKDYESALVVLPNQKYPQQQISKIKAEIAAEKKKKEDAAKAIEDKYNGLMKKANDFVTKTDYTNAILNYKQALEVKPNDAVATAQKEKAEKLFTEAALAKQNLQKEKNYTDTLALADKAFKAKDYKLATTLYTACTKIKPEEKYPVKQIKAITKPTTAAEEPLMQDTGHMKETKEPEQIPVEETREQDINTLLVNAEEHAKKGNIEEASKIYIHVATVYHSKAQLGKALESLKKAAKLSKSKGDKSGEAAAINEMATVYFDSGQYRQSIDAYKNVVKLKSELGDKKGEAISLSELGTALENTYQYDNAVEAYSRALTINQQVNNKDGVSEVCNKLGGIYFNQNNYKESKQYYNQALKVTEVSNNISKKGDLLNSLGVVYYKMGKYEDAIKFYNHAININQKAGNKKNISLTYNNIGNVNFDWNKYEKAIEYYEKSLKIKRELNFEEGMAVSLFNIGNSYLELKNTAKSVEFLNSGLSIAKRLNFREVIQSSYKSLSRLYEMNHDFKSAMISYKSYMAAGGPGAVVEGQISEMSGMYERESKLVKSLKLEIRRQKILTDLEASQNLQKQKELQVKDLELKNQRTTAIKQRILLIFTLLCLGCAGIIALQFFRRYKEKQHYSEVIGFQKRQITDSIEYASRIQKAVLPPGELISSLFPESFIFNLPKDIVSGDYFYIAVKKEKIYVAVADCTGHGVPGAFMSMLGLSLIKEVILQEKELLANDILNELRDVLMKALHQTGREDEAKDGMDIALCVIDRQIMHLEYSGANNPCFIIRNNELIELKPDRMPIGIHPVLKPFTSHRLNILKNDVIYLFSDGFRDQIGGATLKKFKIQQFNEMLINIHAMPLLQQSAALLERHIAWRRDMEQTDDILIVGIKV